MDINNSLAMQVNSNPIDLKSTLGTLSQIQLSQAHAGLYGLQAQQEARKLNALEYLKQNPTDYMGYIQQGGDPANANTLQTMMERDRQYKTNPQGLSTESTQQLTAAGKNIAETGKVNAETKGVGIEQGAKIAQGVLSDPSNDSVWQAAVNQHYQTFGGPSLERQQLLAVKDPAKRAEIAKAYAAQGVSPNTYGTPHNVPPTDAVTTPAAAYAVPPKSPLPPPGQQGGMIGAPGERIIGGAVVQDNGGVIPNQRVSQGFGTMAPAMTPGALKSQEGYATEGVGHYKEAHEKYKSASTVQYGLMDIEKNLDKLPEGGFWTTGTGAGTRAALAKAVNTSLETAGFGPVFDPQKVAAAEAANKGTTRLGFDLAKTLGSREAAMIVQQSIGVQPGLEMTPGGNRKILTSLNVAAQRDKDYFDYLNSYMKQNPQALPGEATIEFNKLNPPGKYVQDITTLNLVPKAALNALRADPKKAKDFNDYYGGGDDLARYVTGK